MNIVITGAGSGIGSATAKLLAGNGHRLLLISRKLEKLELLALGLGGEVVLHSCDVRNYEEVCRTKDMIIEKWGIVDVVINNAGLGYFDPVINGKIEEWHEMFDTNVKGLLNVLHAYLPSLIVSNGHVINIGSVASHQVFPNSGIYAATKHAVLAISESLRLELPDKIRVTTISPGSVNTPFIESSTNEEMLATYREYFKNGLDPEVVAYEILHAINSPKGTVISEIIIRPSRAVK